MLAQIHRINLLAFSGFIIAKGAGNVHQLPLENPQLPVAVRFFREKQRKFFPFSSKWCKIRENGYPCEPGGINYTGGMRMGGFVVLAALAAFGLGCALWVLLGFCLERDRGALCYRGPEPVEFARRYLWLRDLGLLHCPLAVDTDNPEAQEWLIDRGIEIIRTDRREECDAGTGNPSGRDQCRGVSEL
jgi:hypothetical protein